MKRMWSKNELRKIIQETYGIDINKLIDKDGHERFIEGDIELSSVMTEGITLTYGKWSLSGTHLMLVFGFDTVDGKTITNGQPMALTKGLPKWVYDKVVNLFSVAVVSEETSARGDDWSSQSFKWFVGKASDNQLSFNCGGNFQSSGLKHCRFACDLLIDNG